MGVENTQTSIVEEQVDNSVLDDLGLNADTQFSFGEHTGTYQDIIERCPHFKELPREAIGAVLMSTVVSEEMPKESENVQPEAVETDFL